MKLTSRAAPVDIVSDPACEISTKKSTKRRKKQQLKQHQEQLEEEPIFSEVKEDTDYADTLRQHRFFVLVLLGFIVQTFALGARYVAETFAMDFVSPFTLRMLCVGFKLVMQLAVLLLIKVMTPAHVFDMAINSIDLTSGGGMLFGEFLARTLLM